jgi:hypothetical protein
MRKLLKNKNTGSKAPHQHSIWYDLSRNVEDYFSFNRLERHSFLALSTVCLLFILLPQAWIWMKNQQKTDFSLVLKEIKSISAPVSLADAQSI